MYVVYAEEYYNLKRLRPYNKYYKNNLYPEPLEFTRPLYTLLEQEVNKKYLLSDKTLDGFIEHRKRNEQNGNVFGFKGVIDINGYTHTITTREGQRCNDSFINQKQLNQIGYINTNSQGNRIYEDNVAVTQSSNGGGRGAKTGLYLVRQATKRGYDIANEGDSINLEQPNSKTRRGRVGNQRVNTLTTSCNQAVVQYGDIRRLTPRECWRLMGFLEEIYKCLMILYPNDFKQDMNIISLFSGIGAFEKALERI